MSNIEKWENGELGRSLEHAKKVDESDIGLDDALELQLISIRLQKSLIAQLKGIADFHGIGYQPMIRDLLNRFARSEGQHILKLKLKEIEKIRAPDENTKPVDEFLRRQKA